MSMTTLRIIPVLLPLFLAHATAGEPESPCWGTASLTRNDGLPLWNQPCGRRRPAGTRKSSAWRSFSRGSLFSFNWAALHPGRVAAIYVDAPVCDIASWPGGRGKNKGSPKDWRRLLEIYGVTEQEALSGKLSPVNKLTPLAEARIPLLAVVGDDDDVVSLEENMAVVERKYRAMGGSVRVIHKPGIGHHPHSLPDPAPIVDFILKAVRGTEAATAEPGTPVF